MHTPSLVKCGNLISGTLSCPLDILEDPGGKGGIRLAAGCPRVDRCTEGNRIPVHDVPGVDGSWHIGCFGDMVFVGGSL